MHICTYIICVYIYDICNRAISYLSIYISSISHAQTDTHTHTVYIYNTFIHIVCMRLHLSHVCMFSPIGPSAWKTSPLKQWSSAPQWRAHGGGGAGENSLTCCWSTRCNCSNKQSLSTLKILKMLQILKCIFFVIIILFLLSCFDWIYDVFFATKQATRFCWPTAALDWSIPKIFQR